MTEKTEKQVMDQFVRKLRAAGWRCGGSIMRRRAGSRTQTQ